MYAVANNSRLLLLQREVFSLETILAQHFLLILPLFFLSTVGPGASPLL